LRWIDHNPTPYDLRFFQWLDRFVQREHLQCDLAVVHNTSF
jgi:hypothetical protein